MSEATLWLCPCGKMQIRLDFTPLLLAPCCLQPYFQASPRGARVKVVA